MNTNYSFTLPTPGKAALRLATGWLQLGIAALIATGVFSILLAMARTPYIKDIFPWNNFFQTAMVVHVNLSVLMWFCPAQVLSGATIAASAILTGDDRPCILL